ncbi:cytochrome B6 [Candidatus Thiodiazotropha endoloripes]|uniref:Cytochrome B6 n=1 Tax=Candidatus Thiodiazotropha endoloripes TaxID=1818881 RepID=A0A1E2UJH0_9GAMM|nr:cytochrome B6 [Candidatus Thiodiazotropha endoloripes]ODB83531.1 cytochrome B6 [Candidatus Thiodiazotropha endoloripes]ODB90888.1 cytochrome B6 [Candidatus Thiodiazotropha endoloripes]ODB94490.1 cytochrome B6 [Candidatus Thiodiazotropha endoloripes]
MHKTLLLLIFFLSYVPYLWADEIKNEPIRPLEVSFEVDPKLVALGDQLFHDRRLSRDNSLSCASCHLLSTGGTDRKPRSAGVGGVLGGIKAPTVYNSSFNLAQFWDGRAESLEIQAAGPVHNPVEMNSSWPEVISKLSQDASMVEVFGQLFSDGITGENIAIAIAAFEKTLVTEGSRFDRWLSGEQTLSERELRGYRLFKSYGCISCHQGANVGGNLYAYMGAKGDYFKDRNTEITEADYGRYNVTGEEDDKHYFKVPSLRLAAVNSPYFHDGSVSTLDEAIRVMGRYQLGREIPDEDIRDIVAFLHTLVGKHSRFKP